jgi:protein gp37
MDNNFRQENWEIVTGCERLTEGCDSCPSYWEYLADNRDYSPRFNEKLLTVPMRNVVPTRYVVALGSDLFHESVSIDQIEKVFTVMNSCDRHFFEVTTKRAERMYCVTKDFKMKKHITMGVSVEHGDYKWRLEYLRKCPAVIKIVSMVPLLGPIGKLNLYGFAMVGIQPETWGLKREMKQEWADHVKVQCLEQGVIFHEEANILLDGELECPVQPQ